MKIDFSVKTAPEYLLAAVKGEKTFTIRKNDRPYKVGAIIRKCGFANGSYTGECADFVITYVLTHDDFPSGIKDGYCVCGIKFIKD